MSRQILLSNRGPNPLSPLAVHRTQLGLQRLHGEFDVLRNAREETPFIPRDRVSYHAELSCEFALSETEEEPLLAKLPTGQAGARLPRGACRVKDNPRRHSGSEGRLELG